MAQNVPATANDRGSRARATPSATGEPNRRLARNLPFYQRALTSGGFGDMNRASLIIVDAVLLASCKFERQQLAANVVVPGRRRLPTFRVECRNDTAQPVERVNVIDMARLDGTVLARHAVGEWLGGPPPPGRVPRGLS